MPTFDTWIRGFVCGNDFDVERPITGVPSGAALERAWLTVRTRDIDDPQYDVFQVEITTTYVPGSGQITDDGAGSDEAGEVAFEVTKANSILLEPKQVYFYWISVLTTTDKKYTPEKGKIVGRAGATRSE